MKNLFLNFLIISFLTNFNSVSIIKSDFSEETLIKFNAKSTEVFTTNGHLNSNEI